VAHIFRRIKAAECIVLNFSPGIISLGMSFLSKLLSMLFGKKEPKPLRLEVSEIEEFCARNVRGRGEELERAAASRVAEIKHTLSQLRGALKELEKAEADDPNKRRGMIVETSRQNAIRQLGVLLGRLQPPQESGLAKLNEYCSSSIGLLSKEIGVSGKNIAYASVTFKSEIKQLGGLLRELNGSLESLRDSFAENSAVFSVGRVSGMVKEFGGCQKEIESLKNGIESAKAEQEKIGAKISGLNGKLLALRGGPGFREIESLNEQKGALMRKKQEAKTDVVNLIGNVEKPLRRMQKAIGAKKLFLQGDSADFLGEFLRNPFVALKRDPKAEILRGILQEALKAIDSGVIELKEKETEKKRGAIQELLGFNFFEQVFWRFNKIDAEIGAIEKKLREQGAAGEESSLLREIGELQREASQKKTLSAEMNSSLEKEAQRQRGLLGEMQETASGISGRKVSVLSKEN